MICTLNLRRLVVPVLWAAVVCVGTFADAALLPVGSTLFPVPLEAGQPSAGAAMILGTGAPLPFVAPGISGTLSSTVWTNDASNPFGADKLTFTYLLANSAASENVLHRLTVSSFAGFQVDVSYSDPLASGVAPTLADHSTADVVGFSFQEAIGIGPIAPGSSSKLLVIQTDATIFAPSIASVIDGGGTSVGTFAPVAIPEPSAFVLASIGMIGLMSLVRRAGR